MTAHDLTRRGALGAAGAMLAGSQITPGPAPPVSGAPPAVERAGVAPRAELVNTQEYEEQAKLKLAPAVYSLIAGGDRGGFDRITIRPRILVDTLGLDLSVTLFGERLFAPIVIGPVAEQRRFHADGELATVRGASAATAITMVSSRSSVPLQEIAAQARTSLWYQVFAGDPAARRQIQDAVNAGCKAICITVGAAPAASGSRRSAIAAKVDWPAVDALKQGLNVPVMIKGIATPEAAQVGLQHGVDGIIVSNYGGLTGTATDAVVLTLPAIVDAVGGKVPVLADGSFRRGTDILKALAFGAQSVLVARPPMWGLAAYGADGVQGIVEMLQTELARYMAMSGKTHLKMIDRTMLRVHSARPVRTPATGSIAGDSDRPFDGAVRG
jgi:4-hydroxymandelate oxidase